MCRLTALGSVVLSCSWHVCSPAIVACSSFMSFHVPRLLCGCSRRRVLAEHLSAATRVCSAGSSSLSPFVSAWCPAVERTAPCGCPLYPALLARAALWLQLCMWVARQWPHCQAGVFLPHGVTRRHVGPPLFTRHDPCKVLILPSHESTTWRSRALHMPGQGPRGQPLSLEVFFALTLRPCSALLRGSFKPVLRGTSAGGLGGSSMLVVLCFPNIVFVCCLSTGPI